MAPALVPLIAAMGKRPSSSKASSTPQVKAPCAPPPCSARPSGGALRRGIQGRGKSAAFQVAMGRYCTKRAGADQAMPDQLCRGVVRPPPSRMPPMTSSSVPAPHDDPSIPLFEENDADGVVAPAPTAEVASGGLLRGLNPEQLAAVTLPARPALILAGAGSGKTRVLTTRIAWLIQNGMVSPGGVMAVTFTNKAAKEMLTRLSAHVAAAGARHVGRHLPRSVQPFPARALEAGGAAAGLPDSRFGRSALGGQAHHQGDQPR